MTMEITEKMVEAMKNAIEGECDGLAINDQQAKAILEFVLSPAPVSAEPQPEPVAWRWQWKNGHFHPTDDLWMPCLKRPAFDPSKNIEPLFTYPPDLAAENARLREALEPFADIADLIDSETEGFSDTDEVELLFDKYLIQTFTIAQFRRARAALADQKGGGA